MDAQMTPASPAPGIDIARTLSGAAPIDFRFAFGEIPSLGRIEPDGDGHRLSFRAVVGHLPYSVEDRPTREQLLPDLREIARVSGGRVRIDTNQSIVVGGETRLTQPLTPVLIMSALVEMLIGMRPVFEALGDLIPEITSALPERTAIDA